MTRFLPHRLILSLGVVLRFAMTRLSGDLAISIAGANASEEDVAQIRRAYDLDRPVVMQFLRWAGRAATGDLGESYFFREKVAALIGERLPITLTWAYSA